MASISGPLLRVVTDLYVQKPVHSAEEETQYVELALGLIKTVDEPTRAAVVASLSGYANAPAAVLRKLGETAASRPDPLPAIEADAPAEAETDDLVEMFFAAEADERRLILITLDVVVETAARRPVPAPSEAIGHLETAALRRNLGDFSHTLERALGIGRELAERITRDHSGEPIVDAAKAIGMKAAVLQRILLFVNPAIGQSAGRIYELARLFDEITPESAARMVDIWQKGVRKSKPTYQPVHWDDERRSARSPATPARHRTSRGRDEQTSRSKTGGR